MRKKEVKSEGKREGGKERMKERGKERRKERGEERRKEEGKEERMNGKWVGRTESRKEEWMKQVKYKKGMNDDSN